MPTMSPVGGSLPDDAWVAATGTPAPSTVGGKVVTVVFGEVRRDAGCVVVVVDDCTGAVTVAVTGACTTC
jgi:hypothetical protein